MIDYCPDLFNYFRRKSSPVRIGNTILGGDAPVRVQSMTNTSTMDTSSSAEQCMRIADAGADYVRLTAQGEREASNLKDISEAIRSCGYDTPLIADIHFNPKAADEAALHVEKVRINPGNYVDPGRTFKHLEYSDEEYKAEVAKIEARFVPFLNLCRVHHTAIRIGVNHGSLSDRIMSRYGDTPNGMVESCLEFLRICVRENFTDAVVSIKASNTLIMMETVRLLTVRMHEEGMSFPLHLGVTEAGDGEEGRIKSAVGIGSLLLDGIGDTIRVSLSEDPEREIPVARKLIDLVSERACHKKIEAIASDQFDPFSYHRRYTIPVGPFGGNQAPVVISGQPEDVCSGKELQPDYIYLGGNEVTLDDNVGKLVDFDIYEGTDNTFPVFSSGNFEKAKDTKASIIFLKVRCDELTGEIIERVVSMRNLVLIFECSEPHCVAEMRAAFHLMMIKGCNLPVVMCFSSDYTDAETMQLGMSLDFGPLLLDGFGDGVMNTSGKSETGINKSVSQKQVNCCMFGILQACRLRMSKTEYISCPGCGRTLFDLQKTISLIKAKTSHLKGLKIGIMGCVVNGPGEMADADYGYVGAARKKISLYKGKVCIEKNIPEEEAVEKLIGLIRENGDWKDPE